MEMKKCDSGHYYDASIHKECPYCNRDNNTVALGEAVGTGSGSVGPTVALEGVTMPMFEAVKKADNDDGRTVAVIQKDMGIDPVVGWLVCVEGTEKGRDYRIHSDNNYIGRSERMDICIRGDETISRENQAVITYDALTKIYYFSSGDGRSIVRVNDKAIFQTTELKSYDKLTIGETKLLFVPLCGENFEWEK